MIDAKQDRQSTHQLTM